MSSSPTRDPARRRPLSFATEDGVLAEVARLRRNGYKKRKNWTLPQIAWHLTVPLENFVNPPTSPDARPTPEQAKLKAEFVDYIVANNKLPPNATTAPPGWIPPEDAGDADVERLVVGLNKLKNWPHATVESGFLGPLTIAECRRLHLVHAAHHLSYLEPNIARRAMPQYQSAGDVIADVRSLQRGHKQAGDWTLPQACWHLNFALNTVMRPGPYPEQVITDEIRQRLQRVLSTGQMAQGVQAPAPATPPPNASDADVETFVATLERFNSFPGGFAPHRLFGKINDDEMRRLAMIHCGHHLSFFVPTGA